MNLLDRLLKMSLTLRPLAFVERLYWHIFAHLPAGIMVARQLRIMQNRAHFDLWVHLIEDCVLIVSWDHSRVLLERFIVRKLHDFRLWRDERLQSPAQVLRRVVLKRGWPRVLFYCLAYWVEHRSFVVAVVPVNRLELSSVASLKAQSGRTLRSLERLKDLLIFTKLDLIAQCNLIEGLLNIFRLNTRTHKIRLRGWRRWVLRHKKRINCLFDYHWVHSHRARVSFLVYWTVKVDTAAKVHPLGLLEIVVEECLLFHDLSLGVDSILAEPTH